MTRESVQPPDPELVALVRRRRIEAEELVKKVAKKRELLPPRILAAEQENLEKLTKWYENSALSNTTGGHYSPQ